MIEIFIWVISFISLFLSIFWISVYLMREEEKKLTRKNKKVSILVPAYNEEENILGCLDSLKNLDYDRKKLEIIVINDGSTDNTKGVVERFIKDNPRFNVLIVNREKNSGKKAVALNEGLKHVNCEYVGCVDSDSTVDKNSLKNIMPTFEKNVGAVISVIRVGNATNIYGKIQRLEYIISNFVRRLMSKIDTLHVTPGALSIYRYDILEKLKGFDQENITEDLEIAFRLRHNGYKVLMCTDSITTTRVPVTFKDVWNQRVRWFRGFIYNNIKYKDMFMKKKYGLMGTFQYPVNLISIVAVFLLFILLVFEVFIKSYNFIIKLLVVKLGIINLFEIPTFSEMLFRININLMFPIFIGLLMSFFIYYKAHTSLNEQIKHPIALISYITIYPFVRTLHWVTAFGKELKGSKRKW